MHNQFDRSAAENPRQILLRDIIPVQTMSSRQLKIHISTIASILLAANFAFGQGSQADSSSGFGTYWLTAMGAVLVALAGCFLFWRQFQKRQELEASGGSGNEDYFAKTDVYEVDSLDVDKEMEWLRKARKGGAKPAAAKPLPRITLPQSRTGDSLLPSEGDTKAFQERMRKIRYTQLPINSFVSIKPARLYEPLPLSDDSSLLDAIEQANEEFEEDDSIRELAIRVLAAFRTRNSIEALSQIALYDLSANLRSKAVITLTEFDHPSVFEPILLACADPTREVKAAAARGLFRLSFDRADAWKRIMELGDPFRMRHAAHAAVESGIAAKSFDRLIHDDMKVAYEAFALVAFLVSSGATDEIFKAIETHKDDRVKFALIHILSVVRNERSLEQLSELLKKNDLPSEVRQRIEETAAKFAPVAV